MYFIITTFTFSSTFSYHPNLTQPNQDFGFRLHIPTIFLPPPNFTLTLTFYPLSLFPLLQYPHPLLFHSFIPPIPHSPFPAMISYSPNLYISSINVPNSPLPLHTSHISIFPLLPNTFPSHPTPQTESCYPLSLTLSLTFL